MEKVYRVWSGRYSKLVVAKNSDDAWRLSGYKNPDQVELIKIKGKK